MKEGLVTLPEGIVIKEEIRNREKGKTTLRDLPLSNIPDNQADNINKAIRFIQSNPEASSPTGFYGWWVKDTCRMRLYRVTRKTNPTATEI